MSRHSRTTDEVIGLFPTPFLRAPATLDASLVARLIETFTRVADRGNDSSPNLIHTGMMRPDDHELLRSVNARVAPKLTNFGELMFGERIEWLVKEMWVNVLDTGGRQAMHNHANSFVSGVIYLTPPHPAAQTVFMKSPGGVDFLFRNDHEAVAPGPFSSDKWISPAPKPGDMVLFPSYLMHAVPPNPGERRVTLSFNAVPSRLESKGYVISFGG